MIADHPELREFFSLVELSCHCGCGEATLHPGMAFELLTLRQRFARPLIITSAARCKKHNDTPAALGGAGGHPRSLHVADAENQPRQRGCLAVDVRTRHGQHRGDLFALAWSLKWSIGWNQPLKFLHLDQRVLLGLPQTTFDY